MQAPLCAYEWTQTNALECVCLHTDSVFIPRPQTVSYSETHTAFVDARPPLIAASSSGVTHSMRSGPGNGNVINGNGDVDVHPPLIAASSSGVAHSIRSRLACALCSSDVALPVHCALPMNCACIACVLRRSGVAGECGAPYAPTAHTLAHTTSK